MLNLLSLLAACRDEAAHNAMIEKAVIEKVEAYKASQMKLRQSTVLEEANKKADSVLLKNAALWQIDSTLRPQLPTRPNKPAFGNENDTIPIKPLFNRKTTF